MCRRCILPVLLISLIIPSAAFAQRSGRGHVAVSADLNVRLVYENDRPVRDSQVQVELLSAEGAPIRTGFADQQGNISFSSIMSGSSYVVRTSGANLETTSVAVQIAPSETSHTEFVHVRPRADNASAPTSTQPTVAAADLNAPDKAKKEFAKGNEAIHRKDYPEAVKHLRKAIEEYPQFAAAYNNLGLVCMTTKDYACARDALAQATKLNPHSASALVYLAELKMMEQNVAEAEPLLQQALAVEPQNAQALMLMANAELLLRKYDEAVLYARKVDAIPEHHAQATVHFIAARALEAENQPQEALRQYQTFLNEAPQSPLAPKASDAIKRLSQADGAASASAAPRK